MSLDNHFLDNCCNTVVIANRRDCSSNIPPSVSAKLNNVRDMQEIAQLVNSGSTLGNLLNFCDKFSSVELYTIGRSQKFESQYKAYITDIETSWGKLTSDGSYLPVSG